MKKGGIFTVLPGEIYHSRKGDYWESIFFKLYAPSLVELPSIDVIFSVADPVLVKFGTRALYPERWEMFKILRN